MSRLIQLPIIHVRDVVFFPGMERNLFVGRKFTADAIRYAKNSFRDRIIVVTQKSGATEVPFSTKDNYSVGTLCRIKGLIEMTDGTMKVSIEALHPVRIRSIKEASEVCFAEVRILKTERKTEKPIKEEERRNLIEALIRWNPKIVLQEDDEMDLKSFLKERDSDKLIKQALSLVSHSSFKQRPKNRKAPTKEAMKSSDQLLLRRQKILEQCNPSQQLKMLLALLKYETCLELQA